ncbi:MAG: hypothetical protein H0U09_02220 [Geodermatophilaceae bacterium]|nr:hypothetical protein [Geodermatophilaceae bacterium]
MTWLDPVRAALDAAADPCPVFFRDDDAGWADDRLFALLDVFDRYAVAVDVAVIPAELHPGLVTALRARLTDCVRVHQHGYAHLNHESSGRKHEFGRSRDARAQARDVAAGGARMRDAFDERCDPVFTPPWNRCTADTADVLLVEGFRVLSRDSTAPPVQRPGLTEVPVTVDWFGRQHGQRWTRAELAARIAAAVAAPEPVGLMLHHAVTDEHELAAIEQVVALLARHPAVRRASILELAG